MPIRAKTDSKFLARFLIIGLILIGFGAYCLYDGFVAYPKKLEKAKAFYTEGPLETGEYGWKPIPSTEWDKIADEKGWTREEPKTPDVIQTDIYMQYGMAAMSFLLGFPILIHYFRSINAWIEADEDGLCNSKGQQLKYSQITDVDKTRWLKKGIAKITYKSSDGEHKFVIDDLKFLRGPTDEIMLLVESKINSDLVHGAPLEATLPENNKEAKPGDDAADEESPATEANDENTSAE